MVTTGTVNTKFTLAAVAGRGNAGLQSCWHGSCQVLLLFKVYKYVFISQRVREAQQFSGNKTNPKLVDYRKNEGAVDMPRLCKEDLRRGRNP